MFDNPEGYAAPFSSPDLASAAFSTGLESTSLLIADGFSCGEQIVQTTHRRALHLAELLRLAHDRQGAGTLPAKAPVA